MVRSHGEPSSLDWSHRAALVQAIARMAEPAPVMAQVVMDAIEWRHCCAAWAVVSDVLAVVMRAQPRVSA